MKKFLLFGVLTALFFPFFNSDVNAEGANYGMTPIGTNVNETDKTVTLIWSPKSGSTDMEILVSRDGGNEYESLDIVPITDGKYVYNIQCGEPTLWFQIFPRNEDGHPGKYKVDTKGVGSSCEGSTYGGADMRMHAVFTSTDATKKTVTLNWSPVRGSKDVEISVGKYGVNEYVVLDTVPMDSKSYTTDVPCGSDALSFKFTPRNGDGISESYKVNTHGVGGKCEGADMTKANISHYVKDNKINLTWNNLTGSKNIEIFVAKNGDSMFKSLGTVSMKDEVYKYSIQSGDENLVFKFIPKDNSGIESNYTVCIGEKCSFSESITSELLGELSHFVDTGNNTIDFRWTRRIEGIDIVIAKIEANKYQPLDTVPMEKGEYKYFLECGDENLQFQFSAKRVKGYEFTYDVHVQPDEKLCEGNNKRKRTMEKWEWFVAGDQLEILNNGYTREMNNAYKFGVGYGLTSAQNINLANLNGNITRAALAKMMSNFAKNVLGLEPDYKKIRSFKDVTGDLDWKYGNGISESCMLGIMGIGIDNFRPYENVTRAEFGTILSRLVFGVSDGIPYYQTHLNTLKSNGIMNNIDPFKIEKRGNVLLMLMRTAQKIGIQDLNYFSNNSNLNTSNNSSTSVNKSDDKKLLELVELIDSSFVDTAKNILASERIDNGAADGADMSMSKITHFLDTGNNIITLFWDYVPYSYDVEIRKFDRKTADYITLGTVPMYQEYFQYQANEGEREVLFAFIPRNAKGREYRYDVSFESGNKDRTMKFDLTPPFVELKGKLGNTSIVLEKLVPIINNKSESARKKIVETLETYADSNDSYIKKIGTYLLYMLN